MTRPQPYSPEASGEEARRVNQVSGDTDNTAVEVWLIRHGKTELNVQARLSGWTDVELTACGRNYLSQFPHP